MIRKALLAATVTSGLIIPIAAAGVYLPPKPAIIKAENLEFSKHMLLGMPITMGMLAARVSIVPITGAYVSYAVSTSDLTTYSFTNVSIGTAATDRLVIVCVTQERETPRSTTSVTVNGTGLNLISSRQGISNQGVSIWAGVITTGTTANITVTHNGGTLCTGIAVFTIYGKTNSAAQATANGASSGTLNLIANDYVVCVACNGAGSASTATNYTERIDVDAGGASLAAGDYVATGTSSRTFSAATVTAFACASWRAG